MPIRAGASETALLLQDWLMPGQDVDAVVYHPEPAVNLDLEVNDGRRGLAFSSVKRFGTHRHPERRTFT